MAQERGATIQAIGPQNVAQATLGLKGGDVPQNILVPDLLGTVELGRRSEPELLIEQDIIPWRASLKVAPGGAGQFATCELLNPPDVVSVFWFSMGRGISVDHEVCYGVPTAPALATGHPLFATDTRVSRLGIDNSNSVPLLRSGTRAAIIGANIMWYSNGAFAGAVPVGPWVLGEFDDQANDNHWVLEQVTANQDFIVNFYGYSMPKRPK